MIYIYSKLNNRALRIDGKNSYVKIPKGSERQAKVNEDEEVNDVLRDANSVRMQKIEYENL